MGGGRWGGGSEGIIKTGLENIEVRLVWFLFHEKHLPGGRMSLLALSQMKSLSAS